MSQSKRSKPGRSAYWQDLVDQWSLSGLSQAAFCRKRGITYGSFTWWKQRLTPATDDHVALRDSRSSRSSHSKHGVRSSRGSRGSTTKLDSLRKAQTKTGSLPDAQTKTGSFVEVQVTGSATRPNYEVILQRGRVLRIYDPFDSESVARLIAAVEGAE